MLCWSLACKCSSISTSCCSFPRPARRLGRHQPTVGLAPSGSDSHASIGLCYEWMEYQSVGGFSFASLGNGRFITWLMLDDLGIPHFEKPPCRMYFHYCLAPLRTEITPVFNRSGWSITNKAWLRMVPSATIQPSSWWLVIILSGG